MKTIRARVTNIFSDGNVSVDTGKRVDKKIVFTTMNRKDFARFGITVPEENTVIDITCEKHGRRQYKDKDGNQLLTKNYKFAGIQSIAVAKDAYSGVVEDDEDVPFEKEDKKPAPRKRATRKRAPAKKAAK